MRSLMICTPHAYIVRVINSKSIRWVGHVAPMGRGEVYTGFWWENRREIDHLENPGLDERMILK
jgi:hypothetical protein